MAFSKNLFFGSLGLLICLSPVRSQVAMGFVRYDSIPVYEGATQLSMAWGGGLNMLQYSEIDLDQNGVKDLFVFDRSGDKITTYLNTGTPNTVSYVLAPQFIYKFPVMHDWALLRDYNCDGKEDIYTSSVAGFSIFQNTSSLANGLQFQLEEFLVLTDRSPNSTHFMGNLYVSMIDLPAIRDIDGDGDLDILSFSNGGNQVEYHVNMSMEHHGVCDSIEYEVRSNCWGKFSESSTNSSLTLNFGCLPIPIAPHTSDNQRLMHTGSCLECFNFDGDTVLDVLLGDVGSSNVVYIHNSTWPDSAIIDTYDALYPSADVSVDIDMFACPAHIDVNNDGKRDLLFSGAAPTFSENKTSSWYYMNTGTNDAVVADYMQNNFLQENMIDVGEGCYPVLFDYDLDGDKDLLIGNHGYHAASGPMPSKIALYRNNGTPINPYFSLVTDDFAGIYAAGYGLMNLAPTFGDLDGDGDKDMLIGDFNGEVHFFRKDVGSPANFVLATASYQGIDVGDFATPQLYDVDGDTKLDLLIGEQDGKVRYYHNTGTAAAPLFTLITSNFGGLNVCKPGWYSGYSVPLMFDDNGSNTLVVGSERGWLYRYDNIDGNLAGTFTLSDSLYVSWREGGNTAAAVADLNGDGLYDMIIGNYAGGVSFFMGDANVSTANLDNSTPDGITVYPNPANEFITVRTNFVPDRSTKYYLTDVSGKIVKGGQLHHQQTTIDCGDLAAGVYVLAVETTQGILNRKVVISHK